MGNKNRKIGSTRTTRKGTEIWDGRKWLPQKHNTFTKVEIENVKNVESIRGLRAKTLILDDCYIQCDNMYVIPAQVKDVLAEERRLQGLKVNFNQIMCSYKDEARAAVAQANLQQINLSLSKMIDILAEPITNKVMADDGWKPF